MFKCLISIYFGKCFRIKEFKMKIKFTFLFFPVFDVLRQVKIEILSLISYFIIHKLGVGCVAYQSIIKVLFILVHCLLVGFNHTEIMVFIGRHDDVFVEINAVTGTKVAKDVFETGRRTS